MATVQIEITVDGVAVSRKALKFDSAKAAMDSAIWTAQQLDADYPEAD